MPKPNEYSCATCMARWIGTDPHCPNGCAAVAKSEGEYTHKTFQGNDTDLRKSAR